MLDANRYGSMEKMDQRGSGGAKRARGDAGQTEGDWTCPECGNINFAFRNTCNLRKCGASRPSVAVQKGGTINPAPIYDPLAPPHYMGGPGVAPSMPLGNYGMPMGLPSTGGLPYEYSSSLNLPTSYPSPYPSAYPSSYGTMSYGPSMGGGYGYGGGPVMDGPYGMELNMPRGPMMTGPGTGAFMDENGSRKRRGDDGRSEGDWVCPICGNRNFAFRTMCNMRACAAPKPSALAPLEQGKFSGDTPEGSWRCEKCGNINYPFREKCNRKSCGAEKSAEKIEAEKFQ